MLPSSSVLAHCTKVGTSCHLELGGPSALLHWMWSHSEVCCPQGHGEGSHLLGLGECSGASAGGAAEADGCSAGEAPCDKENG